MATSTSYLVVTEPPSPELLQRFPLRTADEYLEGVEGTLGEGLVVINLCRSYQYLSKGYYVSLLADARRQRVFPTLEMIEEINNPFAYFRALQEAGIRTIEYRVLKGRRRLLPKMILFKEEGRGNSQSTALVTSPESGGQVRYQQATWNFVPVLSVFGRTLDERFRRHCAAVSRVYSFPLLRIRMYEGEEGWRVGQINPVAIQQLTPEELQLLVEQLSRRPFADEVAAAEQLRPVRIACLWDPEDPLAPSDEDTLDKLARIGRKRGVLFERIGRQDLRRLGEYDALFIRTVTAIQHYSFSFAQTAESLGIPVIDDPSSIIKCSNKVFLHELFRKHNLPTPRTVTLSRQGYPEDAKSLGFPLILKLPDGTFSQSVKLIRDERELEAVAREMFKRSPLLIAQEFKPTPFDWRIGILERRILWACKYHMVRDHWQIARRSESGRTRFGRVEAVSLEAVPEEVCRLALEAAALIGDGLYGVDIKETEEGPMILEVNDNPNLETGYEDAVGKDWIYEEIIATFLRRLQSEAPLPRVQ